jgi:hypothetical protein
MIVNFKIIGKKGTYNFKFHSLKDGGLEAKFEARRIVEDIEKMRHPTGKRDFVFGNLRELLEFRNGR